jgi:hypothetical protein
MSFKNQHAESNDLPPIAHRESRELAALELRRRQLLRELDSVERQYVQLKLDMEFKGIKMPW